MDNVPWPAPSPAPAQKEKVPYAQTFTFYVDELRRRDTSTLNVNEEHIFFEQGQDQVLAKEETGVT